jgi:hypothetical protein
MFELSSRSGEIGPHAAYRYTHTTFHAINDLKLSTCLIRHLETSVNNYYPFSQSLRALRLL